MATPFPFKLNAEVQVLPDVFIARVGVGVRDKAGLFDALKRSLRFPSAFGANWDALQDRLCDLDWLPRTVVLLHDAVPHLPRKELLIYLRILNDALDAAAEDARSLTIGFAERTRALEEAWAGVKS